VECAPEVCRIAEAEGQRDIVVGQRRVAEIFQRNLGSELVVQPAKGKALLTQLAPQRPVIDAELLRDGLESRRVGDVAQQDGANFVDSRSAF
jgi:hypothetical protein